MHHDLTFSFGSAKVCSPAIFETSFSYNKDIWIAATDYYMYFYIIVLFALASTVKREMFAAIKVRGFPFKMILALLKLVRQFPFLSDNSRIWVYTSTKLNFGRFIFVLFPRSRNSSNKSSANIYRFTVFSS